MSKLFFENYFLDSDTQFNDNKKLVLIIYDIVSNKQRVKFVKFLEEYGVRVQKSAFEAILSEEIYLKLIKHIPSYISELDNVRVYKLKVQGEVVSWGSKLSENEEVVII